MAGELDALAVEVTRSKTVSDSVLAMVKGLADQIIASKNDPTKLQALADSLKAEDDALAAAVAANTPATPAGPVVADGQPAPAP